MLRKWIHKACKRFDISALYCASVGIKCTNPLLASSRFNELTKPGVLELAPDRLRLGFDGLKDDFTLLNLPITDSPHFELMVRMENSKDLIDSPYASRLRAGTLDFRPQRRVAFKHLAARREKFVEARARVESGDYEPIKVITVGGDHFIADGKHRASVCALLGVQVRCLDSTAILHDSFYWWVWRKMAKMPDQFQKHIRWFEAVAAGWKPA